MNALPVQYRHLAPAVALLIDLPAEVDGYILRNQSITTKPAAMTYYTGTFALSQAYSTGPS